MARILVTGVAGFIGFHVAKKLLFLGNNVVGIDSINNYYSKKLKIDRLNILLRSGLKFHKFDLNNKNKLKNIFYKNKFDLVIHLAAQAGVRYSFINPESYLKNNINAFYYVLENCKNFNVSRLFFASSSSIYGNSSKKNFSEKDNTNNQIQFYAVTKKTNENFAKFYAEIYKMNITSMRFFTVYGPWGRPDMAPYIFIDKIYNQKLIKLFNKGKSYRDFTYIDDVVNSIIKIIKSKKYQKRKNYFDALNFGNQKSIQVIKFLKEIEKQLNLKAIISHESLPQGDVLKTLSNSKKLNSIINYKFKFDHKNGIKNTLKWYKQYFNA